MQKGTIRRQGVEIKELSVAAEKNVPSGDEI